MNLVIKLSSSEASSNVKDFTALAALAEKGVAKIGETGTKAMSAIAGATEAAAASAKRAANELGSGVSTKLTQAANEALAATKREADILERIRGPMREYRADMDALDELYKRNKLSVIEYEAELERLIAKQGTMHGPVQQQVVESGTSGAGNIGNALSNLATGSGLLNIANGLVDITQQMKELEDVSTKAANAAQKFADSIHSVDDVIAEQLNLADALHGSLHDTMELFDKVSDGSEGVAMSHREQIALTKALGEAAALEGKSVGEAANLMSKFSYAMQSGHIDARELRRIMREMPPIADAWTAAFGTTREGILKLVKDGKVSVADLVLSLAQLEEGIGKKFATNIKVTNEQAMANFQERIKLLSRQSFSETLEHDLRGSAVSVKQVLKGMIDSVEGVKAAAERSDQAFGHWLYQTIAVDGPKAVATMKSLLDVTAGYADSVLRAAGFARDPWGGDKNGFAEQMNEVSKIREPIRAARQELELLNKVKNQISSEEFNQRYKALVTTLNDGRLPDAIKLWESLHNPAKEYALQLGGLNSLWQSGSVDAHQYNTELGKIAQAYYQTAKAATDAQVAAERSVRVGPRNVGGIGVSVSADTAPTLDYGKETAAKASAGVQGANEALRASSDAATAGATGLAAYNEQMERMRELARSLVEPQQTFEEAQQAINDAVAQGILTDRQAIAMRRQATAELERATEAMSGQSQVVKDLLAPQKAYVDTLKELKEARPDITVEAYNRALDENRAKLLAASEEGKTFAGGMELAFLKLKKEAESFGATLANTLLADVGTLTDALVTAANDGEVAWGKMVESMIVDLEKLILKQLVVQGIASLFPAAGAAGAVAGIAGAAGGADWMVGGSGGTDSKLAAFRVTPGERITVQTPQQQAAGGVQAPAQVFAPKIVNVFDHAEIHRAMESPAGQQVILNAIRQNQAAVRGNQRK